MTQDLSAVAWGIIFLLTAATWLVVDKVDAGHAVTTVGKRSPVVVPIIRCRPFQTCRLEV